MIDQEVGKPKRSDNKQEKIVPECESELYEEKHQQNWVVFSDFMFQKKTF